MTEISYLCGKCGNEFWDEGSDSQDRATCPRCGRLAGVLA